MQRVSIRKLLLITAAITSNLFCLEKPDQTILYEEVAVKPPSLVIGVDRVYVHDILLKNREITLKSKMYFCLAQLAELRKSNDGIKSPFITHNYIINGHDKSLELMSDGTLFHELTQRYWHYYIFQVKNAKKSNLGINLTPVTENLPEITITLKVT